jgi:anti-sigma regulatory factor (Ser/Thr protein kinase)/putative methionine-R-sulfoxide reductase with GAF domain
VAHLYRLSDPGLSDLGLEALLDELLGRIRDILEVDTVAILLLDEETGELVARAADGLEEEVEGRVRIPLGKGFAGRIAAERTPIAILDLSEADVVNPILRERGIRALLGVPLVVEGAVIGVLHVGSLVPREFGTADAVVLELAAARAAPAIERARLFAALEGEHRGAVALQRSLLLDRMLRATRERAMATVIYAVIEPETGRVRYASAGHPPPVLVDDDGARLLEPATGPPVGTVVDSAYTEAELEMRPGETLLLYTDGLIEVRGESLDEGLARLLSAAGGITAPHALCERILQTLHPDADASDDIAVVAVHTPPIPDVLDLRFQAEPETLATLRHTLRRWLGAAGANPEELAAITLACNEAAANAVEHAYGAGAASYEVRARLEGPVVVLSVRDEGRWRESRGEHRGHGQVIMRSAMDEMVVRSDETGTEVLMRRRLEAGT